ncbi:MAG: hypothetical protein N3B16_10480 [Candidatus Aminicenantes bacterium]|nr:hypothetical protein [Candidatus Aminicenantes bacterium]
MRKKRGCSWLGLTISIFILIVNSSGQQKVIEAIWAPIVVSLDGNKDEWTEPPLVTDNKLAIDYAFRHDGRNLYILFIFNDPKFLSTINETGMTIYFSPANKKSKDFGIRFTRKNVTGEELIALMEKQATTLPEEQKAKLRENPKARYLFYEAMVVGKKGEIYPPHNQPGVAPPSFRVGRSGKSIIYEFRVPMVPSTDYVAGIGFQPGQALRIGFEWGGMTPEMRKAMMARMAEQGTTARATETSLERTLSGEEDEGGLTAGGGGGPRLGSTPKKYSFWVDVKIAQGQE